MIKRVVSLCVLSSFMLTSVMPPVARAQGAAVSTPVAMDVFSPAVIKGLQIFPDDPLKFNFIVDTGDSGLQGDALKEESQKLVKYFLASLTTPEDEMWVNLSPLEPDRIIPESFGETEMGRDLLSLDSVLKKTASQLTDPETALGKEFWDKVYAQAVEEFGTTDIPADVINKVWITPEDATVYENGDKVFVVGTNLKVMLQADHQAMMDQQAGEEALSAAQEISNRIMRAVVIPVLEKEVNEGKAFAPLRQIYYSMILATWFKRNLRESVLGKAYVDQHKTLGIDILDKKEKLRIYNEYLAAFKKGAYSLIKEEFDPVSREMIPRKYFSGGIEAVKKVTVIGGRVEAAVRFVKRMAFTVSTLVVLTVMLNACDGRSPREAEKRVDPLTEEQVARSGNYGDMVHDEFFWADWTQDSISKFRGMVGSDLDKKSPREQVIALGMFIKSPEAGLGVRYDTRFLADEEALQKGGNLDEVVQTKRTVCTGFARMLYFMLGHSVSILEVKDVQTDRYTHAMNIIALEDGKVMLVDLSTDSPDGFIMSRAFDLQEYYEQSGDEYHLKDGKAIPWDNQNFSPKDDLNATYQVFKFSAVLPYNAAVLFAHFQDEKRQVFDIFDKGNVLFDEARANKDNGKYQQAIAQYNDVVARAQDLKKRMETNVILRSVIQDPDAVVRNLGELVATAQQNTESAAQNMSSQQSAASASSEGQTTVITGVTSQQVEKFNKGNDRIQELMSKGAQAIADGNMKHDVKKYKLAKTYYKEALQQISQMKKQDAVCQEKPGILNEVEKAVVYNLEQLKDYAEDNSVDNAVVTSKDLGGIDLNAKALKVQITGKKIDFTRFYGVSDLGLVPGFIPRIMDVQPVTDLAALLGTTSL